MLDLRQLNKEQKTAVIQKKGAVIVVAGPGTGKTAVITSKIAFLLKEKVKPEEILCLTFTNKAAREMEERVEKLSFFEFYHEFWISTFHSFCEKVMRNYSLDIGISPDFKIIEETGSRIFFKKNIDKFNFKYYRSLNNQNKFIPAMISFFSRLKDELITPEKFLSFCEKNNDEKMKELGKAYKIYQDLLIKNNFLDFNDLINYSLLVFNKRPKILEKYKKQFKYFLIDEFQDTNYAQYELIKKMCPKNGNILVCCDPNQAIYQWRGASKENIIKFKKDFPKAKEITLIKNYRSFQNILDLSFKTAKSLEKNRINLKTSRKGMGEIQHIHFNTAEHEVTGIINKIIEIKKETGDSFRDFAVLTRTNKDANFIARESERMGVPYRFMALRGLYQTTVILDIISYFRLLDNYHESSAIYRVLNFPCWEIPYRDIVEIMQYGKRFFNSTWETINQISSVKKISPKTKNKIKFIIKLIEKHSSLICKKTVSCIFIDFMNDSKYLSSLIKEKNKENFEYINQFYDRIKRFENLNYDASLKNFIQEIDSEIEAGETGKQEIDSDFNPDAIRISTVHGVKGLEYKHVFISNLVDRKFPLIEKKDLIEIPKELIKIPEEKHLMEEKRLFYVAMTRAMNNLYFTSAENYGGLRRKKISKFIQELGYSDEKKEKLIKIKKEKIKKKTERKEKITPFYFSFTQLTAFLNCPMQYEFAHVLKIPVEKKPNLIFGKAIHNTFHEFSLKNLDKKLSLKNLMSIYDKNWVDEWYQNKKERNEYYRLGKKMMKNFYKLCDSSQILKINEQPALELNFNLKIDEKTTIKGKIDRINLYGEKVEIIDYKTGKLKKSIKKDDKNQLLIYQIAAEEIFKINPIKLTYYYPLENKKISFLGTDKEKKEIKKLILNQIKEIEKQNFNPNPGWHCRYCDFRKICDYAT